MAGEIHVQKFISITQAIYFIHDKVWNYYNLDLVECNEKDESWKGANIFSREGGGAVCLWGGGDQNFWGGQRGGGPVFFSVSQRGGPKFFKGQRRGTKIFSQNFFAPSAQFLFEYIIQEFSAPSPQLSL